MSKKFLNSMYVRPQYTQDPTSGKRIQTAKDFLIVTIKDTETNSTELKIYEEPKVKFYVSKSPRTFAAISIPKEDAREVETLYCNRDAALANALNKKEDFYNSLRNGTKWMFMKDVMKDPNLYMADVDIEDYYKSVWTWENGDVPRSPYRKAYSDTEVDISNHRGFPNPDVAPCPLNTINHFDEFSRTFFSLILRDVTNPQVAEMENNLAGFVHEHVMPELADEDKDIKFKFRFFDTEQALIQGYFDVVHETEPDFVGFWHIDFDFVTILNRMKRLNMNPSRMVTKSKSMCHPSLDKKHKFVHYDRDVAKASFGGGDSDKNVHPSRLWNWPSVSGKTQWYDQMSLYSNMRKRSTLPSYSLDSIGESEVKVKKFDYKSLGYTLKSVIRANFQIFMRYAIKDVYVQYRVEKKVDDIGKYILFTGNARLSKGVKISYVIKTSLMNVFWQEGEIIGNTVQYDIRDFTPGAIVSDPQLMLKKGITINGIETNVFNDVIDFDAASMYPNLMIAMNIAKSTLKGRIYAIVKRMEDNEIAHRMTGADFNSAIQTIDASILDLGHDVFGLPTIDELMIEIENSIDTVKLSGSHSELRSVMRQALGRPPLEITNI